MTDEGLLASLRAAVEAAPTDIGLRLHLAQVLAEAGQVGEATVHVGIALQQDPDSAAAKNMMATMFTASEASLSEGAEDQVPEGLPQEAFDWQAAEAELDVVLPPIFVEGEGDVGGRDDSAWTVEIAGVTLADVGGLEEVKSQLNLAFLAPLRNPELRAAYGLSLRGGLLLYGPPGCGKTYLARAIAGELEAAFLPVGISDVLDMYVGNSERNLHEIFEVARRAAPVVLFFDEIDGLGQKRSQLRTAASMRSSVNQLLEELDGVKSSNEGVFVLAATNHPWDVDSALRRPGRLDRTLLVLPPDRPARQAILRSSLERRPIAGVDLGQLATMTDGFSGADLVHLCDSATRLAMSDSIASGEVRPITMQDLTTALRGVQPSIGPWLETARNVATFANDGGQYDDLLAYLRSIGRA